MRSFYYLILSFALLSNLQTFSRPKLKEKPLNDSTYVMVNNIIIGGNQKTIERVILRELLFKTGDTIYLERLDEILQSSKENLLNTSLFNYVYINTITVKKKYIDIYIMVEERWYLWPYLIFEQADRNLSSFIHEKDWSRINYGMMLVKNNFRGRKETVKLKVRMGYKEQIQVYYNVPCFLGLPKHGISTEISWYRQKQVQYNTLNDQPQLFRDFSGYMINYQSYNLTYYFRNKHYTTNKFSLNYTHTQTADTIALLNPNFLADGRTDIAYFTLAYLFEHDKRNYKFYPLTGYNIDLILSKKGLHLVKDPIRSIWEMQTSAYGYWEIYPRWYTGTGGRIKLSSNFKQPYNIERALGYDEFLRSFEYNLIDGQSFITHRAFIKYELVPKRVKVINNWTWTKFNKIHYSIYTNLFFDHGYVHDIAPEPTNKLPNHYLYSFGAGIDLVTYYDQILRLEYSINPKGYNGFFIHYGKAF